MMKRLSAYLLCAAFLAGILAVGGILPVGAEDALPYTAAYGTDLNDLTDFSEAALSSLQLGSKGVTTGSSDGIPFELFTVDVSGVNGSDVTLTLDAATVENERLALKVYNVKTEAWDTVKTVTTSGQIVASVSLSDYAKDGKLQAMATPDYVDNGSNRILWSTDPQHYAKFSDLHATYEGIHNYMVSEYQQGNIAYVVTTGDIIDDMPTLSGAKSQWITADKMYKILDDAKVPYGIVTGNHDTGNYPAADYRYYLQYFTADRYEDNPWYGGTEDNNKNHYDLLTIGNVDFLFMYIGYGIEDATDTIDWANKVLDAYPHRNAVICTHQYLKSRRSDWGGRAQIMFETIIKEHENVMMVWCGHDDGATRVIRNMDGDRLNSLDEADGHVVHEILCDYQFIQLESEEYYEDAPDPGHYIGSVFGCNGEGYIRSIDIVGNSVSMDTFSPITGGVRPYGDRDHFTIDVDFIPAHREITVKRFAAGTSAAGSFDEKAAGTIVYANRAALQQLISEADAITNSYTADSWNAFVAAKNAANNALKGDDADMGDAYRELSNAIGRLAPIEEKMDRTKLETVYTFDLAPESWQNSEGNKKLTSKASFMIPTVGDDGSLTIEKSVRALNDYPQITYGETVEVIPKDGKCYLYLDVHSENGWSLYPTVYQDVNMYQRRLNYVLEDLKDVTWDAGYGDFVGVYDITDALTDMGVDMSQPFLISLAVNAVPGPLTIREISILTGAYPTGFAITDWLPWIALGAVVLIAVVVLVLVLRKKPKTTKPAVTETTPAEIPVDDAENAAPGESAPEEGPAVDPDPVQENPDDKGE
ncbi:MAG: metallophosphoesterase [Clostridia bacterium]|nr:metallophosphoesterase [Clostridia bacterium]